VFFLPIDINPSYFYTTMAPSPDHRGLLKTPMVCTVENYEV